jgi:hypothetical protein
VQNQLYVLDINGVGEGGNGRSIIAGPEGEVVYRAGTAEEVMPLELDLARVRRSREFGLMGLGQPLKSFRDSTVEFEVYRRGSAVRARLNELGALVKPARGSNAGLNGAVAPQPAKADGRTKSADPRAVRHPRKGGIP